MRRDARSPSIARAGAAARVRLPRAAARGRRRALSGVVRDRAGKPVEFANVAVPALKSGAVDRRRAAASRSSCPRARSTLEVAADRLRARAARASTVARRRRADRASRSPRSRCRWPRSRSRRRRSARSGKSEGAMLRRMDVLHDARRRRRRVPVAARAARHQRARRGRRALRARRRSARDADAPRRRRDRTPLPLRGRLGRAVLELRHLHAEERVLLERRLLGQVRRRAVGRARHRDPGPDEPAHRLAGRQLRGRRASRPAGRWCRTGCRSWSARCAASTRRCCSQLYGSAATTSRRRAAPTARPPAVPLLARPAGCRCSTSARATTSADRRPALNYEGAYRRARAQSSSARSRCQDACATRSRCAGSVVVAATTHRAGRYGPFGGATTERGCTAQARRGVGRRPPRTSWPSARASRRPASDIAAISPADSTDFAAGAPTGRSTPAPA